MRSPVVVVGGILVLNLTLVVGMAISHVLERRRVVKEVRLLEALWGSHRPNGPDTMRRRGSGPVPARAMAVLMTTALVAAGVVAANPDARQVVSSALGDIAGTLAPGSDEVAAPVGSEDGSGADSATAGSADPRTADLDEDRSGGSDEVTSRALIARAAENERAERKPELLGPTTVTASATSTEEIKVVWSAVPDATGYVVARSLDGTTGWVEISTLGPGETVLADDGLGSGTTYHYRIVATTDAGESEATYASATTMPEPVTPSGVTASAVSPTEVRLEWTDVADEIGYRIERSIEGSSDWITIGTAGQDVTAHAEAGLEPGATYHYRIVALGLSVDSPPSSIASVTMPLPG